MKRIKLVFPQKTCHHTTIWNEFRVFTPDFQKVIPPDTTTVSGLRAERGPRWYTAPIGSIIAQEGNYGEQVSVVTARGATRRLPLMDEAKAWNLIKKNFGTNKLSQIPYGTSLFELRSQEIASLLPTGVEAPPYFKKVDTLPKEENWSAYDQFPDATWAGYRRCRHYIGTWKGREIEIAICNYSHQPFKSHFGGFWKYKN